ncbi:MAG: MBL fold metallo-hydrolase [Verrucomicrobia bacterium]|nr:MBL fold metallo-hydrolase [Verrucomicrobiota bacterium]
MNLEDNLGDVLRKARMMAKVELADAARVAGLSESDYGQLEDTGKCARTPDLIKLGGLLGIDGKRAEKIGQGWLPTPPVLSAWREFRQITTEGDGMAVHAYLIWDEATREAALFDTGFDAAPIVALLDQHRLDLKHLFITHSHADHLAALQPLRDRYPNVRLHSNIKAAPPDQRNRPNDFVQVGSLRITNRDTPGHAEDGVTYVVGNFPDDAPNLAVVGDAIFAGSMGGAKDHGPLAKQKVREQILSLPPSTLICPGHGPLTTVGQEREHNPFYPG